MIKILINDGISADGRLLLEEAGYELQENKIPQAELASRIGEYDVLLVRSATKVTKEVIDAGKKLKIIGRGGVGMDNIDVEYAQSKGIKVINTPKASSAAVAELAFAHIFSLARMLHMSNREMPAGGDFKKLKNAYADGLQIRGKVMGIIGFGRIGQEVARIAVGLGMKVVAHDPFVEVAEIDLSIMGYPDIKVGVKIPTVSMSNVISEADFLTIHVPGGKEAVIGAKEIAKMKTGAFIINAARGGVVEEAALLAALDSGKIAGAGIDVFDNEPSPRPELINHPKVSCTPHIGASTIEAQSYIGMELADKILEHFGH